MAALRKMGVLNTILMPGPSAGSLLRAAVVVAFISLSGCTSSLSPSPVRYRQIVFTEHLIEPQAVAPISYDSVLVAGRSGKIVYVKRDGRVDLGDIKVAGAAIAYLSEPGNTEGLKDLVPLPKTVDQFVWCATTRSGRKIRWSVGRLNLSTNTQNAPQMINSVIWQSDPQIWKKGVGALGAFSGCRIAVRDNDLLVAMGANDRISGSGRIMRISLDRGHASAIVSTGHRNPGGIVVKDGKIWEVEFGSTGGDELNLIVPHGDYGWPQVSKGEPQGDGEPRGTGTAKHFLASRPGSIDPTVSWTPSINPAGMTVWGGKLYISALVGSVLELTTRGTEVVSQRRFLEIGDRVRDVRASRDGRSLWVMTDGPDARLIRVEPNSAA